MVEVEWLSGNTGVLGEVFMAAVHVDDPDEFEAWLDENCPNHYVSHKHESISLTMPNGKSAWRYNVMINVKSERVMFKLRWYAS